MSKDILNEVMLHHTAILGKTGSGKTSTEKLLVEQAVEANFRVCVLDSIKSDWWGITSSANGKKPGLPFKILGGPRGHVPLHSSAGKAIGKLVGSGQLPLSIIDMADFEPGGLQRFFIDFSAELMRSMRGVVYLVIEEAHEFAPKEKSGVGSENMATHWAKKLATAGRSKGIRLVVATQRTQALHNAVLGSCETIIVHRLTAPADQGPVLNWLKANADKETVANVEASLSSLPTGSAWVCSGEARIFERMSFPKFTTFDNTATPTNDADQIEVATAPVDQDELRSIIGDAVKEAEANDPTRLKRRIAELEKAASNPVAKINTGASKAEIEAAEKRGYESGLSEGYKRGAGAIEELMTWTIARIGDFSSEVRGQFKVMLDQASLPDRFAETGGPAQNRKLTEMPVSATKPAAPKKPLRPIDLASDPFLNVALSVWPAKLTWAGLASACGRKARGGSFNTRRKHLIDQGLVVEEGDLVVPTNPPETPDGVCPADLLEQNLPTIAAEAFKVIRRNPGISLEELADHLGVVPRGGSWNTRMSILRKNGLITEGGGLRIAAGIE